MKENRSGLDQPVRDGAVDPLEANRRSVDEARRVAKKWLWFAAFLLLFLLCLNGLALGDWISVAILWAGIGVVATRAVGELREPRVLLTVRPSQLASRILEDRDFWETRGRELRDTDQRMQVQNLLDELKPRAMWLGRDEYRVAKWIGVLAGTFLLVTAVWMLVARESLLEAIAPLMMASLFGGGAVWSARAESQRREAVELLEGAGWRSSSLEDPVLAD